jgi:hypothetical protein
MLIKYFTFSVFFLAELGFELMASLAKQMFYSLNRASSPFGDGSLVNYLPRLDLNLNVSDLSLPSS